MSRVAFTGFTQETQDFLWGIRFNNNREWFLEHKQIYLDAVYRPMRALCEAVGQTMEDRFRLGLEWRCCRIYRDARRLHGRGPYKENLWFVLSGDTDRWTEKPVFYFELRPDAWDYGLGCYHTAPGAMERFRQTAAANPAKLERLIRAFDRQKVFQLFGAAYKRPKGSVSPLIDRWYNQKQIGFSCEQPWDERLFSPELADRLTEDFALLVPLYKYFLPFAESTEEGST